MHKVLQIRFSYEISVLYFIYMNIIVYLCRMKMRKIIYLFAILLMLSACGGTRVSEKLDQIDSLIAMEQIDSACMLLKEVAGASMIEEDQAHYGLLATQLGYITNQPLPSDSLLDLALNYYNKVGNIHKLADTYYYKSARSRINQDYPQAILYCKEAERLADQSKDVRLQFKIAENLAYLNGLCENDLLQLQYAQKSLALAQKVQNKNWIAYSYNKICFAFYNLGQQDSSYFYIEKSKPYIEYVYDPDKAAFLMNIGLLYKEKDKEKAKAYFEESLNYGELPDAIEHLADVYFAEGKKEEAYQLWKKALTTEGRYEKDNIIRSILVYDLQHGNLDEASKKVSEVIAIKDSIINVLRNDTIKDLQLRFDHEVAMHQQEQVTANWQKGVLAAVILVILLTAYIIIKRVLDKNKMQEVQMQINDYMSQIRDLEASGKESDEEIARLNKQIKDYMDEKAPDLLKGCMYYEQIKNDELKSLSSIGWSKKHEQQFVDYYAAIDYRTVNRLRKIKRKEKLTTHNLFYLLLLEMGKNDKYIANLFGISERSIDTIKTRTKPVG